MRVVLGIVAVLSLAVGAAAQAQVTVKGDARAWQEVAAAYERLARLRTYRMKMKVEGQPMTMVVEHVSPDRTRTLMQAEGFTMEMVSVGDRMQYRTVTGGTSGPWQCQKPPTAAPTAEDARNARGEVTISRLGEVTVEGVRTQGYDYSWTSQGKTVRQRLYVAGDGLPRRLVVLDDAGKPQMTIDYYDFNAPITIEFARCG
ncbi:MAG: hypothetical protein QN141_11480 [Armatimonadota bacterium]|nr:hypothetical protein [Armatimonadota bacterium]MDR7452015.1 hypothetical protein [Armatimonadota bacterium]MDR7467906.1 hypothetical protein [Armatimonadota bacterium]MDR7494241.1 hypothetical protein [Armatimonadota bacterium]MDR7500022.1 hypothetical protein [Armatimonadota bacterium]